jgi:hypothetical protein
MLSAGVLAASLAAFAPAADACSQCVCGMPFPPDALGGPAPQRVRLGFEERYLSKSNALEDAPGTERESEHHAGAFALARVSSRLMILGRLPYVWKQITEAPLGEAATIARSAGLGDAELTALYKVREFALGRDRAALLSVVGGTRLPTGANRLADGEGARLDEHLQSGTGAWSGLIGADVTLPLRAGRFDANVSWRMNAANAQRYRYGDALLYNVGFARRVGSVLELSLQANGRSARRDMADGISGENTGGSVLYACPTARWFTGAGIVLESGAQFPIQSALNGEQEEHATARFALSLAR